MSFVIMAGGSGTRFWPVSRKSYPKQFLSITGRDPMVVQTYSRIKPLTQSDLEIFVVVGAQHADITRKLFSGTDVNVVVEPMGKNTAPCIGLSAVLVQAKGFNGAMAVLPSDHYVALPDVFRNDLNAAINFADKTDCIVTLGIIPTRPETGYGYIEVATEDSLETGKPLPVRSFKEKPDIATAERYLASGRYLWNAGIFIAKPSVFLGELSHALPEFYQSLERFKTTIGTADFDSSLVSLYQSAPNISFDYAVMEKAKVPVFVVPSSCGWSDVGSWFSLYELKSSKRTPKDGNISDGEAFFFDATENFVYSTTSRSIVVLGLSRTLVVDTEEAILVASIDRHQDIRAIPEYFAKIGKKQLV
ncbi:MAG: mannose-1-phosphate guanylyltransferase [Thermodesulforhabdaceae bacterium]